MGKWVQNNGGASVECRMSVFSESAYSPKTSVFTKRRECDDRSTPLRVIAIFLSTWKHSTL
jgi:hypothetical protein